MFFNRKSGKHTLEVIIEENIIIIENEHFLPRNPRLVLTTTINNSKFIIMSLNIITNEIKLTTLSLVDAVDGSEVHGSFANTVFSSSDPSLFSVDNAGKITPVNQEGGAGTLSITTDATYTNTLGNAVTETKSLTIDVTVEKLKVADAVNLVATFSNVAA